MKKLLVVALVLSCSSIVAEDLPKHPVEAAEATLDTAKSKLKTAAARLRKAIALIEDEEKRTAAKAAFDEAQKQWRELVDAELELFLQMTPVPDSSTAAMLGVLHREAKATETRAKALIDDAKFLEANYQ